MSPFRRIGGRSFPFHIVVFLAPAVIIYSLFMIYPLVNSLRLGFYTAAQENSQEGGALDFLNPANYGIANYKRLLTDDLWQPRLEGAIKNNIIFFLIHMFVQNPIALLLATLLSSRYVHFRTVYRTLIFMPTMLSYVLVGFVWQMLLSPLWGKVLWQQLGIWEYYKPFLGLEGYALPTLSLISVWQFVGVPMMLFLAALISIPDELIEAARVDGATAWSVFWHVKFPLILPTVGIVAVLTFVGNFNAFDLIYTTQGGLAGPNFSADILGTFFHRTFFGFQLQLGNPTMGAAIAGIMFLIILTGVLLYMFGWQRRVLQVEY